MDVVTVLRRLAGHPFAVATGVVVAVVVGVLLMFHVTLGADMRFESRQYKAGIASASVLLDSAKSQVSDLGGPQDAVGPAGLQARAQVLANLLVASPLRERIAADAGIPRTRLITKLASGDPSQPVATTETIGLTVRENDRDANVLTVRVTDQVPILTFNASAPSRQDAARLSNAAVAQLRRYLDQTSSLDAVPPSRKLVMKPLGAAQSSVQARGPARLTAIGAALFVFARWCGGILAIDVAVRRGRSAPAAAPPPAAHGPVWLAPPAPPERASESDERARAGNVA